MLENIHSCLKSLENSYMLSYKEVSEESKKLKTVLEDFEKNDFGPQLNKSDVLRIAETIESLSIKNEYKISLIKDFPEYFSNNRLKK